MVLDVTTDLETLRAWAADKAVTDEDEATRPVWAQIAAEVGAYLAGADSPEPAGVSALPLSL